MYYCFHVFFRTPLAHRQLNIVVDKTEVHSLVPNQKVEGDIEELAAAIRGIAAAVVIGDPDIGLHAEVESVDVVRRGVSRI